MKSYTKTFLFFLPLMVLLTIVGWTVFGALPGMQMTGDLIAWLLELPIVTCYALAAGGAALLLMNILGMNIENEDRCTLMKAAWNGDPDARASLRDESLQWLAALVLAGTFFWPHY